MHGDAGSGAQDRGRRQVGGPRRAPRVAARARANVRPSRRTGGYARAEPPRGEAATPGRHGRHGRPCRPWPGRSGCCGRASGLPWPGRAGRLCPGRAGRLCPGRAGCRGRAERAAMQAMLILGTRRLQGSSDARGRRSSRPQQAVSHHKGGFRRRDGARREILLRKLALGSRVTRCRGPVPRMSAPSSAGVKHGWNDRLGPGLAAPPGAGASARGLAAPADAGFSTVDSLGAVPTGEEVARRIRLSRRAASPRR
jgi:hypothetical protein